MELCSTPVDLLVVGAGISGVYAAVRAQEQHPEWNIVICEASSRTGGRLLSIPAPDLKVEYELGGMRFFPEHVRVRALVSELGLTAVEMPYIVPENYAYLRQQHLKIGEIDSLYSLPRSVDTMLTEVPSSLEKNALQALLPFGMEFVHSVLDSQGYHSPYDSSTNSLLLNRDLKPLIGNSTQYFVQEGYEALVTRLVERFKGQILLRTECREISDDNVRLRTVFPEQRRQMEWTLRARKCVLCCNAGAYSRIKLPFKVELFRVSSWQGFKVFCRFPKPVLKWGIGRHVTDLPLRQVWILSPYVCLVYNDAEMARFWRSLLSFSSGGWKSLSEEPRFQGELQSQLETFLQIPIPECQILWKFWEDGWSFWRPGYNSYPPTSIEMLGMDFSSLQGWVEGALTSVDQSRLLKE